MFEQISLLAAAITAPSETEKPLLEALCTAAMDETAQRLRPDVTAEDCGGAFLCAAAMTAAAGLLFCRSGGELRQLSAGDVSLRLGETGGQSAAADSMRRCAAGMMAPYWADGGFAFQGVKG